MSDLFIHTDTYQRSQLQSISERVEDFFFGMSPHLPGEFDKNKNKCISLREFKKSIQKFTPFTQFHNISIHHPGALC